MGQTSGKIEFVYLNGLFLPAGEATVSVFDAGLLHGAGLFETLRSYNGRVFRGRQHLNRLYHSAEVLHLSVPEDADGLLAAMHELLRRNGVPDARLRLTVTMGDTRLSGQQEGVGRPNAIISAVPLEPHPQRFYDEGTSVLLAPWRQSKHDAAAGHKTLGYMPRLLALRRAQQVGLIEALWFTTDNLLAEGCISNVLLVKGGTVKTPPVDTPVLPGVTRAAVIEVARAATVPLEERPLTINDLLEADEVFLTSTVMEVMPVCRIERHVIADDKPGPVSRRLLQLFRALVQKECPAQG
jgi:branched-chain amino acid aminotransferase